MPDPSSPGHGPAGLIDLLARADPSSTLLILEDGVLTYGEVLAKSAQIAQGLRRHGLARGERIAVLLPNGKEWFLAAAACARLGLAMVSLNVRLGPREIGEMVARTSCAAIIYDPILRGGALDDALALVAPGALATLRLAVASRGRCRQVGQAVPVRLADLAAGENSPEATDPPRPDEAFLLLMTSGTTSAPKLAVHTQARIARHAADVAACLGLTRDSRMLLAIPVCGAFGFTTAMTAIAGGLTLVVFDEFRPATIAAALVAHKVTHMMGTNDMMARLLAERPGERPFPSLRLFGVANFTPGLTELPLEAERRGVHMRGLYGLSETMAFLAAQPEQLGPIARAEGGGRLVCPAARMRVRDPDSGELVGPGQAGELEVHTPDCMIGYDRDPGRTASAFTADGYLRTGDIVVRGPGDTFTFVSRMGDILRIGGYLVSPAEIEDLIKQAGPIEACQVVAVALSQTVRPVAFVVPVAGERVSPDCLMAACAEGLAVYKRPIRIFTLDSLPLTDGPNGAKVKKHALRELAMQLLSEEG